MYVFDSFDLDQNRNYASTNDILSVINIAYSFEIFKYYLSADMQAAVDAWGERGLLELEAEERLAVACEKSPTQDPVVSKLRNAFRVGHLPPYEHVCIYIYVFVVDISFCTPFKLGFGSSG